MKKLIAPSQRSDHHAQITNPQSIKALHGEVSVPDEIVTWFGRLKLLYGLPFNYLVPDERMLPIESIRFFQVDPNWVTSLVAGAFSLGSATQGDHAHDQALAGSVQAQIALSGADSRATTNQANQADQLMSGFLLRSAVVADWPGLEVEAYSAEADWHNPQEKLEMVRMERLAPNVLLCLFAGLIHHLLIHEPTEGLHFGVDLDEELNLYKQLWQIAPDRLNPAINIRSEFPDSQGNQIHPLPLRAGNKRVLDIQTLAESMADEIDRPFTAAEFALQMVEGVESVHFKNI